MTDTLATAAVLLVPFLAIVLVGAVAVAVHDGVAAWWAARRAAPAAVVRAPVRPRPVVAVRAHPVARRAPALRPAPARSRPLVVGR